MSAGKQIFLGGEMIGVFLAAALASQADLPKAAADTVEVEISSDGVAKIEPQAFQVAAFLGLPKNPADSGKAVDLPALKSRLARLEMPARDACMPSYPVGFIGNEAYADDTVSATESSGDASATGWTLYSPQNDPAMAPQRYSGLFATRAAANQAAELLRSQGHAQATMTPVLFDCADAIKQAQLDALAKAQTQIQPIADALGRRVLGVTRIEFSGGQSTIAFALAMSAFAPGGSPDKIEMPASAKVQFLLGR